MTDILRALSTQPLRLHKVTLDFANEANAITKPGIHCWLVQASSPTVEVRVSTNNADAFSEPWGVGQGFRHWPFDRIWLRWPAQPGQWALFAVAGEREDWNPALFEVIPPIPAGNVQVVNAVSAPVPVSLQSSAAGNVTVDLAAQSGGPLAIGGTVATAAGEWAIDADTVYASHALIGIALTTIYTVPAGKDLVLRKSFAAMYFRNGTIYPASAFVSITDAADVEKCRFTFGTDQLTGFVDGLVLPTGWKIKASTSDAGGNLIAYVTIVGYTR